MVDAASGGLSRDEKSRLAHLETEIADGMAEFVRVGRALAEIQEHQLYRQEYVTFEAYCQERWGFSRRRGYQFIEAAAVVDSMSKNVAHRLSSDAQARALLSVPAEDRHLVLEDAVAHSNRTGPALKRQGPTMVELDDAVRRYQDRPSREEERESQHTKMAREAEVLREYRSRPTYTPPAAEAAMDTLTSTLLGLVAVNLDDALQSKDVTSRRLVMKNLPVLRNILERLEREL